MSLLVPGGVDHADDGIVIRRRQMMLDANLPVPIYYQLKSLLFEDIVSGRYPPGSRLPTEHELCEMYGISRTPVTRALGELAEDGVVIRRRRVGTIVNPLWRHAGAEGRTVRVMVTEEKWEQSLAVDQPEGVQVSIAPWVALPRLHRTLTRLIGAGHAPDVALMDSVWVAEFARAGFILPLEDVAPLWTSRVEAELAEPFPRAVAIDGSLFAVPEEGNIAGVWYRTDLLDGPPPDTWDEFLQIAEHARRYEKPIVFPAGTEAGETTTYWLTAALASNGVLALSDDHVTLDNRATVETLRFLRSLVDRRLADPRLVRLAWDQAPAEMVKGRTGIIFGGSYEAQALAAGFGVSVDELTEHAVFAPFPSGPDGTPSGALGGMVWVVLRQSKNPAAVAQFLEHILQPERLASRFTDQGTVPGLKAAIPLVGSNSDFASRLQRHLGETAIRPVTEAYHLVSLQLQRMVQAVMTGRLGAAAATERTADLISAITGLPVR